MAKRTIKKQELTEDIKKARIENWAKSLGLDSVEVAKNLVEKYGIDKAYQLARDVMMKPADVAKKEGVSLRTSKAVMEHLAKTEVSEEGKTVSVERAKEQAVPTGSPKKEVKRDKKQESETDKKQEPKAEPKKAEDMVQANQQLRHRYIDKKFHDLDERMFNTHDEYMQALRKQYAEMRQYEWETVCLQETLDMYNLSSNPKVQPNTDVWLGKIQRVDNRSVCDSNYVSGKSHVSELGLIGSNPSCAGTAVWVDDVICESFGYEGKERFYQSYGSCASARYMHSNPATKEYSEEGQSIEKMLKEGKIGAGTMLSVPAGFSGSGYHAMTVAEVIKNSKGDVTDIVLQGNNTTSWTKYSVKGLDQSLRSKYDKHKNLNRPFIVTSTHCWTENQIAQETNAISDADLERRVAEQKARLRSSVDRLAEIEEKAYQFNRGAYLPCMISQKIELDVMIGNIIPPRSIKFKDDSSLDFMTDAGKKFGYSNAEKESVKKALLGMKPETYDKLALAVSMKADRAEMDKNFETVMSEYFKENGVKNSKENLKVAFEVFSNFIGTEQGKGLTEFHKFVEEEMKKTIQPAPELILSPRLQNALRNTKSRA